MELQINTAGLPANIKAIEIATIKEKALMLVPKEKEYALARDFDNEMYLDLIENIEDYIAEGVASYFLNNHQ